MQHDQDIAIQITIKGVKLCITIEADEQQIPAKTSEPEQIAILTAGKRPSTNHLGIEQVHTKSAECTKIKTIRSSAEKTKLLSPVVNCANEDTVIKGYRVKVKYDESAASRQDILKSIVRAGKAGK